MRNFTIFSPNTIRKIKVMKIKKMVGGTFNSKIIDIGSADGSFASLLLRHNNFVAVDMDEESMKKNCAKRKIIMKISDRLPFKDNSFDYVLCFEFLEHQKRNTAIKIIREIYRILKEDGVFVFSTPNYLRLTTFFRDLVGKKRKYPIPVGRLEGIEHRDFHYYEFSIPELREILKRVGFKKIIMKSIFIHIPFTKIILPFTFPGGNTIIGVAFKGVNNG